MLTCFPNWGRTSHSTTHHTFTKYSVWENFVNNATFIKITLTAKVAYIFHAWVLILEKALTLRDSHISTELLNFCVVATYKPLNLIWLLETVTTFKTKKRRSKRKYISRQNRRKLNTFVISARGHPSQAICKSHLIKLMFTVSSLH